MSGESQQRSAGAVRAAVRERYGQIAEQGKEAEGCGCAPTGESCCGGSAAVPAQDPFGVTLYDAADVVHLPPEVTGLSLGCGDPVTLASLQPGQTVLDLGSGGGIDCFLAARKVAPGGRVIGVDMTPAMVERARANREKMAGEQPSAAIVEFRLGEIEHLPVADGAVDVIISNCVINLSADKEQVLREAYRVLRPDGRLAISDVVTDGPLPPALKNDLAAWAGCVAGALDVGDYLALLDAAGFVDAKIERTYWAPEMVEAAAAEIDPALLAPADESDLGRAVFNARLTARKPAA